MGVSTFPALPFKSNLGTAPSFSLGFFKHIYIYFRTKNLVSIISISDKI